MRSQLTAVLGAILLIANANAADNAAPEVSAKDIASRLSAIQEGTANARVKMEFTGEGGAKNDLQVQIKQRRTGKSADFVYQILWPKERKDEAVILHQGAGKASGTVVAQGKARPLSGSEMGEPVFGSDLSCADIIENFFAWDNQAIVGQENVNRADCVILESKPGGSDRSIYSKVKTWVDAKRLVPMRVEKYSSSGRLARRIDTTRVVNDDKGRPIPANLTVSASRGNGTTEIDGSRIKHDVGYSDKDFSPEGLASPEAR